MSAETVQSAVRLTKSKHLRVRLFLRSLDALHDHVDGFDAPSRLVLDLAPDVCVGDVGHVAAQQGHDLGREPQLLQLDRALLEILVEVEGRSGVSFRQRRGSPSDPVVVVSECHVRLVHLALLENPESPDLAIERGVCLGEVLLLELDETEISVPSEGTGRGEAARDRDGHGGCCDV